MRVPERAFMVTLLAPRTDAWQPSLARASLSVTPEHSGSETPGAGGEAGAGGQAGAGGAHEPDGPPWITATLRDPDPALAPLLESTPFLMDYKGVASVPFTGDCEVPDPDGWHPCRLRFTVTFARSPLGNPKAETELRWSLYLDAGSSSAELEAPLELDVEIEPL